MRKSASRVKTSPALRVPIVEPDRHPQVTWAGCDSDASVPADPPAPPARRAQRELRPAAVARTEDRLRGLPVSGGKPPPLEPLRTSAAAGERASIARKSTNDASARRRES